MLMTVCSVIESYQTLISGILILAGVMLTLHCNAKLARNERITQRRDDILTLRVALFEETKLNEVSFEQLSSSAKDNPPSEGDTKHVMLPAYPMNAVYRHP